MHAVKDICQRKYSVFSGHFMDALEPKMGISLQTITVLRDPVQRTISNYAHVRRDPYQPWHELAQKLTLREFCQHPDTRELIENYQAVCLSTRTPTPENSTTFAHPLGASRSTTDVLSAARDRLERCVAVGVTEQLPESLVVFADALGLSWNGVVPFENVAYNRPILVEETTIGLIREMTTLDAILYREAVGMLEARIAALKTETNRPDVISERRHSYTRIAEPADEQIENPSAAPLLSPKMRSRIYMGIAKTVREWPPTLRAIARYLYLFLLVFRDPRVKWYCRIPIAFGAAYFFSPISLIPNHVALFGRLDDFLVMAFCLWLSIDLVAPILLTEFRAAAVARFEPS